MHWEFWANAYYDKYNTFDTNPQKTKSLTPTSCWHRARVAQIKDPDEEILILPINCRTRHINVRLTDFALLCIRCFF